jgi:hypothetical protein
MNNFKNLMYARNSFRNIPQEEIDAFEAEVYADENVTCVNAVHCCENYDDETEEGSQPYTWYIPTDRTIEIEIGDTLVVEQTVGIGLAFVKAVSEPYPKTREQHENEIHPYSKVVSNLGNQYL